MIRVVMIGDTDGSLNVLQTSLLQSGMGVQQILFKADVFEALRGWPADVAVIDAALHVERGLSLATRLRLETPIGIVLLASGTRARERLMALSAGVDHCFTPPLDLREVELNIRNLQRRLVPLPSTAAAAGSNQQPRLARQAGDTAQVWCFDPARWQLHTPAGCNVHLSLAEYHLLRHLLSSASEVVSRADLLRGLDRHKVPAGSRNLDMIISRLRRKVARTGDTRLPVQSARGIGYVFTGHCRVLGGTHGQ